MKAFLLLLSFAVLLSVPAPAIVPAVVFAEESDDDEEQEEKKEDLEDDIDDVEDDIEKEQKKADALSTELQGISRSISAVSQVIGETQDAIEETEETISRKEAEIRKLEEDAARNKTILAKLLLEAYYREEEFALPEILSEEDMFRALNDPDRLLSVGDRIKEVLVRIQALRATIEGEKVELEGVKQEKEQLLEMKEAQKSQLASEHAKTSSELARKEATIAELRAELSKLRTALSSLLGTSYDTDDILDAAKFASKQTGVRKDFILGMLVVESNLGRYTGGCTYKEVEKGAEKAYKNGQLSKTSWNTFKRRRDIFKDIADDLDYDYKKLKVSCNPSSYAGTGGAMGVAQFMPDTWRSYESQIVAATGHNPPDPWDLADGVSAMAIKLAKVPGVTKHKESAERDAAKLYLSGTTSSKYNWYADRVLYWADNYKKLL